MDITLCMQRKPNFSVIFVLLSTELKIPHENSPISKFN